ncbi:hypothetical protein VTN77DRAFT_6079 [Rasamsonia byssochlamydoides]|uniref:uncharacterized protein n=1 Tax=Rasamsonia byssochlamydoides TaxID=89139 RepID=UPI003742FCA6
MADTDPVSTLSDQDSLFDISESLIPIRELKPPGTTSVSFDGLLKDPLVLKEDLKEGCGGQLWPAGLLLAKYMLREHHSDLLGKTIVELGAGGGLVGLAVARGCSVNMPIYITDQESMLPLMEDNIKINGLSSNVRAKVLNWGTPPPADIPTHPGVVLAADCVYFEPAFPLLISTLRQLLGPESVCYFCFKRRRRADMRCIKQIKKIFDVVEIRDYADYDTYARDNLFLYKIKSRDLNKDDAALDSPMHVKAE